MDRVNGILNQYFKNFAGGDQWDWADYVGLPKFRYNAATHLATKLPPFKVAYGVHPLLPTNLAL